MRRFNVLRPVGHFKTGDEITDNDIENKAAIDMLIRTGGLEEVTPPKAKTSHEHEKKEKDKEEASKEIATADETGAASTKTDSTKTDSTNGQGESKPKSTSSTSK